MIIDNDGKFLSKKEILELAKTEDGKKQIFTYITRARSAYAAQRVMERLQVIPDESTQMDVCLIIFQTCFRVPIEDVMEYIESMKEHMESQNDETIHYC